MTARGIWDDFVRPDELVKNMTLLDMDPVPVTVWIPPELHFIILQLVEDEKTLLACALVCKSWVRPSRASSSISCTLFTNEESTDYLLSLLSSSLCTIVPALKSLDLGMPKTYRRLPSGEWNMFTTESCDLHFSLTLPETIALLSLRGARPTLLTIRDGPVQIVLDSLGASVRQLWLWVNRSHDDSENTLIVILFPPSHKIISRN